MGESVYHKFKIRVKLIRSKRNRFLLDEVLTMAENYQIIMQELVRRSNEETRRLKTVEQRLDSLEDKVNIMAEGGMERAKKTNTKITEIEVKVDNLINQVANLESNVDKITRQLAKFAQKRDLKEIENMINLLTPIVPEQKQPDIRAVRVS